MSFQLCFSRSFRPAPAVDPKTKARRKDQAMSLSAAPLLDSPLQGSKLPRDEVGRVGLAEPAEEFLSRQVRLRLEPHDEFRPHSLERVLAGSPIALRSRFGLVGRAEATRILAATAERAQGGGIYVVALTGPQGMGRGRMLEAVRDSAAAFGFDTAVDASCSQLRRSMLRPFRRALSDVDGLDEVRAALTLACSGDALAGSAGLEAAVEAVEEALVEAS